MGNRKVGTKSFVFAFAAFFAVLAIGACWVARALAQAQPVGPDAVAAAFGDGDAVEASENHAPGGSQVHPISGGTV